MKKAILLLALAYCMAGFTQSFSPTVTKQGNTYTETQKPPQTEAQAIGKATKTGDVFKTKAGEVYPVYISTAGKLFVVRQSKATGNFYKQYLKTN